MKQEERRKKRREFLLGMPFVTWVKKAQRCEGIKWGEVPLKALYNHGPNRSLPPEGLEKYRCKLNGHYKFRARRVKYPESKSGTYCMQHLYTQLWTNTEQPRFTAYYENWKENNSW